jgi:hypothetical protein
MANEIIEINTSISSINFQDKRLQSATKKFLEIAETMRKSSFKACAILAEVAASKCYKKDGFENMQDWAEKTFGLKKSVVYAMAKVGRDYVDAKTGKSTLAIGDEDFTVTQVSEVSKLPKEKVVAAVKAGEIKPTMTCAEIRDYANAHISKKPHAAGKERNKVTKLYTGVIFTTGEMPVDVKAVPLDYIDKQIGSYVERKQYKSEKGLIRVVYELKSGYAVFSAAK